MKLLITGPTGTAGSEVVRLALLDNDIESVTALTRRPLPLQHPKLQTVIHQNFLDDSSLVDLFQKQDACIWCLGISQTQVSKEDYEKITFDYTIEAATTLLKANPAAGFVFLSGQGADSTEQSRTIFARVKGKAENALNRLPFSRLIVARPGGIKPAQINPNTAFMNKLMVPLFPLLELFAPNMVISATDLARALLRVAKHGSDKQILENADLRKIAQQLN